MNGKEARIGDEKVFEFPGYLKKSMILAGNSATCILTKSSKGYQCARQECGKTNDKVWMGRVSCRNPHDNNPHTLPIYFCFSCEDPIIGF